MSARKKVSSSRAVEAEVLPPRKSVFIFPAPRKTVINHADALFMVLFRWALLVLSVAGWACSVGILVIAAVVVIPALAFGGIAWALHRTASLTR
jgi:hypothetical protein